MLTFSFVTSFVINKKCIIIIINISTQKKREYKVRIMQHHYIMKLENAM